MAHRIPRLVLAGAVTAAGFAAAGCASCESGQWAQNAPSIRSEIPASRQVQLGAWREEAPRERDD